MATHAATVIKLPRAAPVATGIGEPHRHSPARGVLVALPMAAGMWLAIFHCVGWL